MTRATESVVAPAQPSAAARLLLMGRASSYPELELNLYERIGGGEASWRAWVREHAAAREDLEEALDEAVQEMLPCPNCGDDRWYRTYDDGWACVGCDWGAEDGPDDPADGPDVLEVVAKAWLIPHVAGLAQRLGWPIGRRVQDEPTWRAYLPTCSVARLHEIAAVLAKRGGTEVS